MHMADALLSTPVGVGLWVVTVTTSSWAGRRLQHDSRSHLVPLMGVLGAFVFAAQMLNFAIPGTGSSGHLGGGLLLASLLGGPAAFLVMASVLLVQALLFADGGLLAWGANVFNLGVWPCLVLYPLVLRPLLARRWRNPARRQWTTLQSVAVMLTALVALQLGAVGVVLAEEVGGGGGRDHGRNGHRRLQPAGTSAVKRRAGPSGSSRRRSAPGQACFPARSGHSTTSAPSSSQSSKPSSSSSSGPSTRAAATWTR